MTEIGRKDKVGDEGSVKVKKKGESNHIVTVSYQPETTQEDWETNGEPNHMEATPYQSNYD